MEDFGDFVQFLAAEEWSVTKWMEVNLY